MTRTTMACLLWLIRTRFWDPRKFFRQLKKNMLGIFIPTLFRKSVGDIVIASVRPSVRLSVMLSPPKPLDRIQPNFVNGLLTQVGRVTARLFLAPPPGTLGRGQKVKY